MAYRSNFPAEIDSFLEHYEITAADVPKVKRFQELKLKANRTPSEDAELSRLTIELRDKFISAEDFNKFQDALVQMQIFIRDNVQGYIDSMKTDVKGYVDNAKNDITTIVDNYTDYVDQQENDFQNFTNQKKNEIQNLLDQTTAGQLNNRIDAITSGKVESFIEFDSNENPVYIYGVNEDFDLVKMLENVQTLAQRDAISNPSENSFVYVINEKQVYKFQNGKWTAVLVKKVTKYVWLDADNVKTIDDIYYNSPTNKSTSIRSSGNSNTINVNNNILRSDFIQGSTYLEIDGVRYKVNSITPVTDSNNNHVSTNIVLNVSIPFSSGQVVSLISCAENSHILTEYIYINNKLIGIKHKDI